MKRVAITGSTGSMGSHLVKELEGMDLEIVTVCDEKLRVEHAAYFEAFENPEHIDVLYHLAAKSFVPDSWKYPSDYFRTNILGTSNALDFCNKYQIKMVFISSYMYGIPEFLPITEEHPVEALNPYALSKLEGEKLCKFYGDYYDVDYVIVRPFNVYGDIRNKKMLIPEIIEQIQNNHQIKIKDLTPKRDYVHIDDLVDFLSKVGFSVNRKIYNIGSGVSHSVKEIIDACQQVWESNLPVISENIERVNEIPETISDIAKAKLDFDWRPEIDLKSGLQKMKKKLKRLN
jgi:UDP-glucose 4-epimerase